MNGLNFRRQVIDLIKYFKIIKNTLISTGNYILILEAGKVLDYDDPDAKLLGVGKVISLMGLFITGNRTETFSVSSSYSDLGNTELLQENLNNKNNIQNRTRNKIHSIDMLKVIETCHLFAIPIEGFNKLVLEYNEKMSSDKVKYISNILIFSKFKFFKLIKKFAHPFF